MSRITRRGAIAASRPTAFSPITSIPWAHAYWLSGPESLALGLADGAAIGTIPDEIATADLTQATAGSKPTLRAASASFNSKPIAEFDGTADFIKAAWTPQVAFPFTIYLVARTRNAGAGINQYFSADNPGTDGSTRIVVNTTSKWSIGGNNGSAASTGNANANAHAIRLDAASGTSMPLYVDETNVIAGGTNIQSSGLDGFSLGARSDGAAGTFAQLDIAFAAIIGRALTSLEIADMHAWAQTTYAVT